MKALTLGVVDLPGRECSVAVARRYVADLLRASGHVDVDDAVLAVSEVVTNAVVHTASGREGGVVTVEVTHLGPCLVCVEVIDDGPSASCVPPGVPVMRRHEEGKATLETGGRGLWLVDEVTESWGVRQVEKGRGAVWMRISTSAKADERS